MNLRKLFSCVGFGVIAAVVAGSVAQTPARTAVDLSLGPLSVTSQAVNIALALSVEFPTAGAAYRTGTYDHTQEYLGYWDPKSCYEYFDAGDNSALNGNYFRRTGAVDSNKYCNATGAATGYTGNVLNFAATSSIDLLRYALTGGNRVLDTGGKTVLGRAFLPSNFSFRDGTYFPGKQVAGALVGKVTPPFKTPGATTAYGGIVYFTSCDDFLMVGNSGTGGSCTAPGNANNFAPMVPNLSGSFGTLGFVVTPVNTSTTTYVIDPGGKKYWDISQPAVTVTVAPSGSDATAGALVPQAVSPTPRNLSSVTGTSTSAQYAGDAAAGMTYTATSGTTTTAPSSGPLTPTGSMAWVTNTGSAGTADYEGILAELDSTNWGPNGASGTVASNSKTLTTCRKSSVDLKIRVNSSNGGSNVCPSGYAQQNRVTARTYRLFKSKIVYLVYASTPYYNQYQQIPAWYQSDVYTVYEVYNNETSPARMKAFVQVCDAIEGPNRKGSDGVRFCKRYPSESASTGTYKPVGELQDKAEAVRVSAFGYALEDGTARYGGVLRAPMKFLGPNYRDTSGALQSNTAAEWDAMTGIFIVDPLNAAAGSPAFADNAPPFTTSGVANYLNKFGSTGTYKSNDPVGELYYETLRYFQGLQPTVSAVTALLPAAFDNFPIYKKWTDPIQNGCERRNFILTIGDVNTHADGELPGNGRAAEPIPGSANTFDSKVWTKLLAGFETGSGFPYNDSLGRSQLTTGNPNVVSSNDNLDTKGTGSGGSSRYLWAGAAYWANTQSIRYDSMVLGGKTQTLSGIHVKTFTVDVDEGGNGLIDGNTRGIPPRNSSFYLAGKYGWFNDANDDGNPFKTSGGVTNNKEWEDAALPNVPDGYTLASQAQRMIAGIRKFFAASGQAGGSVSVSSISSQRFTTNSPNGDLFAPQFSSRDWSGTVKKTGLVLNTTTATIDTSQTVFWDAGSVLTAGTNLAPGVVSVDPVQRPSERRIFTYRREANSSPGIAFIAANFDQLDAEMRTALNTNPVTQAADGLGTKRIDYLRGEKAQEAATTNFFRPRSSILGDIINSGPVYKKEADSQISDDGDYAAFVNTAANRTAAIYVGANDGMLHAFRATDGKELFAYIPSAVGSALNQLTDPKYQHRPFVDGVPQVGEAKVNNAWRTVLVGGMGGGAQGVFALDVTDPNKFEDGSAGASKVMFEFTDRDDAMMGNVLSQPKLVKVKIPAVVAGGSVTYKWFVAVASGYNNYLNDGAGRYTTSGDQALFLLSLDKTPGAAWAEGSNYFKITVPASTSATANGLANPGLIQGDLGQATVLYAGDLHGNIWKFDLNAGLNAANIAANLMVKTTSGVKRPLFTAMSDGTTRQPITVAPLITTARGRGVMLIFGTGKFMEQIDAISGGVQSIYGVWDSGGTASGDFGLDRSSLQRKTATENATTVTISTETFVLGTATAEKRGWYLDLPNGKERIATEGGQGISTITFNSTIPSGDCSGDGDGRSWPFDPLSGNAAGEIALKSSIGLLSRPNYISLELTDQGNYGVRRPDGVRKYTARDAVVSTGTRITDAGNVGAQTTKPTPTDITTGRISWREIRNFKD